MTKNVQGVLLKKSKLTTDGKPNLPAPGKLVEGELALNYAEGVETISTKNESGTVVTFSSDDYYTSKKLGSGFTGVNSAKTVTEAIEENEFVWANAYAVISGAISSHTEDTDVHVTLNEKTAWGNKADGNHVHDASGVTAMTGYQVASSSASVLTTDTLLQTIGKLEKRIELLEAALGGMTLVKLTSQQYADLAVKDPNTLYIIND
jgi:hypothetical protein